MKLEDYQVKWLKEYFIKHLGGSPKFSLNRNETLLKIVYDLENDGDILASSDIILDLIKQGFYLPFFGVTNDIQPMSLHFAVGTPDEWMEYD